MGLLIARQMVTDGAYYHWISTSQMFLCLFGLTICCDIELFSLIQPLFLQAQISSTLDKRVYTFLSDIQWHLGRPLASWDLVIWWSLLSMCLTQSGIYLWEPSIFQNTKECCKNTHMLIYLRALIFSMLYKNHMFQWMGKIFCGELHMYHLKFHTIHFLHAWKDVILFKGKSFRAIKFESVNFIKQPSFE